MAGGEEVRAHGLGEFEEAAEFDDAVALDARVRRAAFGVGAEEVLDDGLAEHFLVIERGEADAELVRDGARVLHRRRPAAAARRIAASPRGQAGSSSGKRRPTPMTSYPCRWSSAAAVEESTPPDMPTTTRLPPIRASSVDLKPRPRWTQMNTDKKKKTRAILICVHLCPSVAFRFSRFRAFAVNCIMARHEPDTGRDDRGVCARGAAAALRIRVRDVLARDARRRAGDAGGRDGDQVGGQPARRPVRRADGAGADGVAGAARWSGSS